MTQQDNAGLIRRPAVAGRFYTADPSTLLEELRGYLRAGPEMLEGEDNPCPTFERGTPPLGIMLPHAGYMFSGAIAGRTLGLAFGKAELTDSSGRTFVLLGPSHTGRGAPLAVWPGGFWRTPLGDAPVDAAFAEDLCTSGEGLFTLDTAAHMGDHALEVMVPFVQTLAPEAEILPITVSRHDLDALALAGHTLAELIDERARSGRPVTIIASSDLNHFLPHDKNMRQDALALEQIKRLDPAGLFKTVTRHRISMCGFASVTLMLCACLELGATDCCVTEHSSSGLTGRKIGADMERVVGYAGAIIWSKRDSRKA